MDLALTRQWDHGRIAAATFMDPNLSLQIGSSNIASQMPTPIPYPQGRPQQDYYPFERDGLLYDDPFTPSYPTFHSSASRQFGAPASGPSYSPYDLPLHFPAFRMRDAALEHNEENVRREAAFRNAQREALYGPKPQATLPRGAPPPPPIFFIDEPTNTRIWLHISPNTPLSQFLQTLDNVSVPIATQIKTSHLRNDGTILIPPTPFTRRDGNYLFRTVHTEHNHDDWPVQVRSDWINVHPRTYHEIFEHLILGKGAERSVEVHHVLQHFRNVAAGGPPTGHRVGGPVVGAVDRGVTPRVVVPLQPPVPVAEEEEDLRVASPRAPSPIVFEVGARSVVQFPPVPPPRPALPQGGVPVSTGFARGVVDGGDLKWYRVEEALRGSVRFGDAVVVESLDVWRGWL